MYNTMSVLKSKTVTLRVATMGLDSDTRSTNGGLRETYGIITLYDTKFQKIYSRNPQETRMLHKQVIELYTEDGCDRPFFCLLETPGSGNVVRVVNTAPVEFPMTCAVVPNSINEDINS